MQREQNAAPYVAAAGMGAIAEGVGQAGNVFSQLSAEMAQSKNHADLARADDIMQKARAQHAEEILSKPENEWAPLWESKYRPQIEGGIKDLGLSTWSRQRVEPEFIRFDGRARTDISYDAHKVRLERDKDAMLNGVNRDIDGGNIEKVAGSIQGMVASRHITPEQGEKMLGDAQKTIDKRTYITSMNDSPFKFQAAMNQAKKDGKSEDFPRMQPEDISRFSNAVDSEVRVIQQNGFAALDDEISTRPDMGADEVILRMEELNASQKDTRSMLDSLTVEKSNTPEGKAEYMANYDKLMISAVNYDPITDTDGKERLGILRDIRSTAIPGERQFLMKILSDAQKDGMTPEMQRKAGLMDIVNKLATDNLLMEQPKTKKEDDRVGWANYEINLNRKKGDLYKKIEKQIKDNPSDASKDDEWLKGLIGPAASNAASKSMWQSPSTLWSSFMSRQTGGIGDFIPTVQLGRFGAAGIWGDKKTNSEVLSDAIRAKVSQPQSQPKPATGGSLDSALIDSVKQWEGFSSGSFDDYKQTSIGYGTKGKPGETITKAEADKRLTSELETHAARVDAQIAKSGIKLNQNQRNALISFDFNTGEIEKLMTSKSAEEIARRLPTWNKVTEGGKLVVNQGLINRRKKELEMFNY